MIESKFEGITPLRIIESTNKRQTPYKEPGIVVITPYIYGQTIILKGNKTEYENLINFWLGTQSWYGTDGEDCFFETLFFDDLSSYSKWQEDPNRVGVCKIATLEEKGEYDKKISIYFKTDFSKDFLIMNSLWNEHKVLFMDDENYYLFYFWTGE